MKFKRIGCFLLSLLMMFSNICVPAYAAEDTYESGNFIYSLDGNDNAIINGLSAVGKELTEITIPETIDDKTVVSIKSKAFSGNENLAEITIPSNITSIGFLAFSNCSNLKTVNYNTSIAPDNYFTGAGVFAGSPVEVVNFGSGITSIPNYFLAEVNSSNITINSDSELISMGNHVFRDTTNLTSLSIVNDNITNVGASAFYNSAVETITSKNINLDNGKLELTDITSIGNDAFVYTGISEVNIPSTVTSIGFLAFQNCSNLKTVNYNTTINPSIYFTGDGIFAASPVEVVNLGSGITTVPSLVAGISSNEITINSIEEITTLNNNSFGNASNLEKITFTNSNITIIGKSVFENSTNIKEIVDDNIYLKDNVLILDNVISIGEAAFASMSIKEVTIPNTVTGIGSLAFSNCSNLETINYNSYVTPSKYFTGAGIFEKSPVKTVNFGVGINSIPANFLANISSDEVVINSIDPITVIGEYAFYNNSNLNSVVLKNANVAEIGLRAFAGTGLTSYTIPDSVLIIGNEAFVDCSNLSYVELLHEVAPSIGNGAFKNMAANSIIRVKNADVAAAFTNNNYSVDNTVIKIGNEFHITYKVEGNGTITRDGLTDVIISAIIESEDDLHSVVATPDAGNKFVHWVDVNGNVVSTDAILTVDMPIEDETYMAVFERIEYTITFELDSKYGTLDNYTLTKYYGDYISDDEIGINMKDGYSFKGWLSNGSPAGVIRVFDNATYTASVDASKYNYNINVYYNNELHDVISSSDYVDTVITDYKQFNVPASWKFVKVENCPLTISADESKNNINVYYELDTENYGTYKVEYYYDNELGDTLTYTVPLGTVVERVILRDKTGYIFNDVEGLPLTVNDSNGVIKMHYITDDQPEYTLTIEYYYNDVIDSSKTETIKLPKGTKFNELVAKVDYNTITGFEYKNLEYIIPEAHDGHLYRVEYYYDGVIDDSLTETDVELPNIDEKILENTKDGYVFVDMTQFSNIKIDVDGIKIKVKYETESYEPGESDYLTFKVQYYYSDNRYTTDVSGARLDNSQTDTITVPKGTIIKGIQNKTKGTHVLVKINSVPMVIDKEGIVIKAYYLPIGTQIPGINSQFKAEYPYTPDKPIPSLGDEFYTEIEQNEEGESVIRIYYKSDMSEYIVNYYYDGVKDEALTEKDTVLNGTVINTYIDKVKENYTFDRVIGLPLTVSKDGGNIINVYYTHKTADYSIEYYFDGIIDSSLTETDNVKVGTVISSYTDKIKPGYELDEVVGSPLTVGTGSDNTIKVYYKSIPKYDYRVEYYYNNEIDNSKTDVFNVSRDSVINSYTDKSNGYELDKVVGLPLTVIDNNGVIKVYYKLEASYSYEYYFDGVKDDTLTETAIGYVGSVISTYVDKVKENYELDKVENLPLTISKDDENIIRIYYKTIKVDYSVEYYFDGVLDSSLTEISNAPIGSVVDSYTDKVKTGYELDKILNLPLTISNGDNVIKVYYKTIKVPYTVEYYFDNEIDNTLTDEFIVPLGSVITSYEDKVKENYELDKVIGIPLTAGTDNVIRVYYKTIKVPYTVEYYFDNVLDSNLTETSSAPIGTVISGYTNKVKEGFELDKVIGIPLTLSTSDNVIKVYYKTSRASYTVEYYFDGIIDNSLTDAFEDNVGAVIDSYIDKCKEDYSFDKVVGLPLTVGSGSVIKVYYEKNAPVMTSYTIEYYYDNILDASKTEEGYVIVGTIVNTYPDKAGSNYELDKIVGMPLVTTINGENLIKVYYKSIELPYSVEYYFDGVIDSSLTDNFVAPIGTVVTSYTDKVKSGYELDEVIGLPLTVGNGSVIKVYYKTIKLTYTVEYYYNNTIDNSKTDTFEVVYGSVINNYVDKCKSGYRFDKVEGLPLTVKAPGNVIKVYYEKIPVIIIVPDVQYTIEYYFDNVIDKSLTDIKEAAPGTVIKYTPDKCKDGYEYDRTENLPLTVSKYGNNVIKVYYNSIEVVPETENYTVEYYFNNVFDDSLTVHSSAIVGTVINSYVDKCKDGFVFDKVENLPLTVKLNAENIIRVYYKEIAPIETTYKVNYFYNYNLEITETFKGFVGEKIESVDDKIRDGYRLEKIETLPLVLKEQDNVINVYYVSEDSVQTGLPAGRIALNIAAICLSSGILYFILKKKRK